MVDNHAFFILNDNTLKGNTGCDIIGLVFIMNDMGALR